MTQVVKVIATKPNNPYPVHGIYTVNENKYQIFFSVFKMQAMASTCSHIYRY